MKNWYLLPLFCLLLTTACEALIGEEIVRIPVNALSESGNIVQEEGEVRLEAGDEIAFWADMNMAFEQEPELMFRLEIQRDNIPVGIRQMNPLQVDVTINQVRTEVNGKTKWRYKGKMEEMEISEAGIYTFRAMLMGNAGTEFTLNLAELVIRR